MNKLPIKPSELIELALADLAKIEEDPRYEVDMDVWVNPEPGVCAVCLAGAVMVETIGLPVVGQPHDGFSPYDLGLGVEDRNRLKALDRFRKGRVRTGLILMEVEHRRMNGVHREWPVPKYFEDPALFRQSMEELTFYLKENGL